MSFTASDSYIILKNQHGETKRFVYPFIDDEFYDFSPNEDYELIESSVPFKINLPLSSSFSYLNSYLESLENSGLGKLTNSQIADVIDGDNGGWSALSESDLEDFMVIHESDPASMALKLSEIYGEPEGVLNILGSDISSYLDWNKVGNDLIKNGDITDLDGVYIKDER